MSVRLQCPSCQSTKTWATYIHYPCPKATLGNMTIWDTEAMGPTPDGTPEFRPCPAPADEDMVPAHHVTCRGCNYQWTPS
jgi:hypothetical protein